jgi:hypothetical protein
MAYSILGLLVSSQGLNIQFVKHKFKFGSVFLFDGYLINKDYCMKGDRYEKGFVNAFDNFALKLVSSENDI